MKIDVEILVVWIICNNFAARKFNLINLYVAWTHLKIMS